MPAPTLELADILRQHGPAYRQTHSLPLHQHRLMQAIENCRTPVMGGSVEWCDHCHYSHILYRSCRNRHCPKCQGLARARWLKQRTAELLPTEYFHVVFTLPEEIAAIAFLNGVAQSMNAPSYQALVPRLVKREDLTNAIALNSAQYNMSRILGPTLGGYAMALMGVAGNFFLNGLSFLAVLFALTRIRYPVEKEPREESMLASLRAGFRYVRGRPQMFVLVGMIAVSSLLTMPFLVFIPYFARVQLGAGASGMGWLFGASGAGAVMGAITVAWLGNVRRRGWVISLCGAGVMAAVVVFCYTHIFALSVFLMLLEGYGMILTISSVNVAMQHLSSDEMRGRTMSIYGTCFLGLPPLGALLAGELSRHIPTSHALALMSGVSMLVFLGFFTFSRALRELD